MRANDHLVYRTKHPIIRRNTRQQPFSILNIRVGKITDLYGEMACTKFSDFLPRCRGPFCTGPSYSSADTLVVLG